MSTGLLLDTHAILWWALDQGKLSQRARAAVADTVNTVFFSPVSGMEIATKVRIGKLEFARPLLVDFDRQLTERGFEELPLRSAHSMLAGSFASPHNDPWDRLLAAQAQLEQLTLVTNDGKMNGFGVPILW